ncbi:MAG: polysaccharide biosynthesis tyrosine autokinase [Clostridium sp.]|nr:polysaccharide biosynthesis tyrosine autokinase [Prevotella sp.]MCM1428437.1 polysaccharide biosynthesis tyrosine autokinase [Clostridium sp.]MCM1474902.1 polysaccharide biosynthesis tyrosine autokinase [Muribaculaceae bacterium]
MADLTETPHAPEAAHSLGLKKPNVNMVNIADVLVITLKHWYWIVLSLVVCVGIAWLYLQSTVPLYTSSCQVMIRDDAQSPMGASSIDFEELGIKSTNTVIEDEMVALKSPDLMQVVVEKLGIDVCYRTPGMFHDKVLYGKDVPVIVSFDAMPREEGATIKFHVNANGDIDLQEAIVNNRSLVSGSQIRLGSSLATSVGPIKFDASPFYQPGVEYDLIVIKLPLKNAVNKYLGEVNISSPQKKSNVVDITCVDPSQTRANDVLTALIEAYNQNWINAKAQVVANTNRFITERLTAVEAELGSVDGSISNFKSSNLIPDVSQASNLYMQESNQTANQILALNNQLQMARYLRNYVTTEGKNQVLPVNTGLSNSNIEGLITEYNTAMMQRNARVDNSSESNPIVQEYDSRLAALRRSILSSIDNQEVSLTTSISNLERNEQSATARVAANPRQARFLLSAERQQKVQESLYLYLLQKREENELSQAFTQVNTRVIRRPDGSGSPTSPNTQQIYLIAFVVGLALPFCVTYAMESSNSKVRGRKDLESLHLPVIGEIPKFKHTSKLSVSYFKDPKHRRDRKSVLRDVVVEEGNRDLVNEAFRVLRTNVNFITADSTPTVVMLTSFNPGSGKTFVSVNLGISLAIKHRKVLLVDCDLRRASLSRFVSAPHKGLATYLAGAIHDVDPVIQRNAFAEGLDILPVGAIPPNPTELLETQRFSNLIEYLRSEYEYVILDCPPVEMMADAQIVAQVCDRTFFVVRVGLFERVMLDHLERLYSEKKYPNMSVILNDSVTGSRYGYSYRYGYGYSKRSYYNYGYGQKSK